MNIEINYPSLTDTYKHYKGGLYKVITLANNTETKETMVVYQSLLFKTIFTRPLDVWNSKVKINDKEIERFKILNRI